MQQITGTGVALITPFKKDFTLDVAGLERITEFVINGGVDYLVVLGTTGESATLTKDEKELVKSTVIRVNNNRLPLVLGIGGNSTAEVVHELQTTDLTAFCAVLSVSPYYNRPTQEGIYQHFKMVAQASKKPVILYNVPGRTASNMLPATVIRLASEFKNVVAIKEAAGDTVQAMRLLKAKPDGFMVISGDDIVTLPITLMGGSGVISVLGLGFPKEFSKMVRLAMEKNISEANKIHFSLMEITDLIFEEGNPAGIKAVYEHLGLCESTVRLPLVPAGEALKQKIAAFIKAYYA